MPEPHAAAAPAAAPAAPAAPPATPSGKAPPNFDTRLALARTLGSPRTGDTPAPPSPITAAGGNIDADPDADDPADGGAADPDADGATDDAAAGDDPAAADTATPESRLEAVIKAFEAGDVDAMAKALEKPGVKIAGPVRRAFRAFQRRQMRADERDRVFADKEREFDTARGRAQQSIADDSRRIAAQERGLIQRYGWAHQLTQAWEDQDMLAVGQSLEKACKGASLATITQMLATGKTGKTAEEKLVAEERRKLDDERAAEARKKQTTEDTKAQATKREAAVGRVGEALKTHPYLQTTDAKGQKALDQEALDEVFTAYEKSWNGEKFTKTARKCADELQDKLVARAKARGLAPAAPAAAAAGKNGKLPPPAQRRPVPRAGVREPPRTAATARGTPQDLDSSRANRLAQARRLTEMQKRGVR